MTFDPTKPVQTRDGHPARIVCTDLKNNTPFNIVALTSLLATGQESVFYYTSGGRFRANGVDHPYDLVNVPVRTSTWENVYEDRTGLAQESKEKCDCNVNIGWTRLGYLRRDFGDGVFVSAEFEPLTSEEEEK